MLDLAVAIWALWLAARAGGLLAQRLRQPPVLGEILGGLLLGPTVLGAWSPSWSATLTGARFGADTFEAQCLSALSDFGLALLMFGAGLVTEARTQGPERTLRLRIAVWGTLLPLAVASGITWALADRTAVLAEWFRPEAGPLPFALMLGCCVAVTSLPVLSRILRDLGLLQSAFAQRALGISVLTNLALIMVMGLASSWAEAREGFAPPLLAASGTAPIQGALGLMCEAAFLLVGFLAVRWCSQSIEHRAGHLPQRLTALSVGWRSGQLLVVLTLGWLFGLPLFLAAFAGGLGVRAGRQGPLTGWPSLERTGAQLVIPLYFGIVGATLDLRHALPPLVGLVLFLGLAVGLKFGAVHWAARRGGVNPQEAQRLAIALNARGGPGIVFAEIARSSGAVTPAGYAALLLLAVLTSIATGMGLARSRGTQTRAGQRQS